MTRPGIEIHTLKAFLWCVFVAFSIFSFVLVRQSHFFSFTLTKMFGFFVLTAYQSSRVI